ncbi:hypothetical protein EDP1_4115 [Pseudomonas putida S610]|nr:hypothetical protein EDP1_4115 [Pseudomonas putida S610]
MPRCQSGHRRRDSRAVLPDGDIQIDQDRVFRHMPGRAMHQHGHGRAVGEHVANTRCRVVRVDRHIRAARLQDPEQPHHHRQTALDTDRHPIIGLHTQPDQVMRQAVGLGVELFEGERAFLGADRHRRRCASHLGFDQPVQGVVQVVVPGRGVEHCQDPLALGGLQHWQVLHAAIRGLLKRRHQRLQHVLHLPADTRCPHCRRGRGHQAEGLAHIVHVQPQGVVAAFLALVDGDACARRFLVGAGLGTVPVVEHGAEQRLWRGHATATLGQGQRGVLVGQQFAELAVGRPRSGLDGHARQVDAQRQGIDEHAQGPLGPLAALHTAQQHRAEYHRALPCGCTQQTRPAQVEQAGGADAQAPCLAAQTSGQGLVKPQRCVLQRLAIALHITQAEGQGRFLDRAQLRPEERFMLVLAHAQARLGHIIAVRHRRLDGLVIALQVGDQLLCHHFHCCVVHHDVMELQGGLHVLVMVHRADDQAHQRCLTKVEFR